MEKKKRTYTTEQKKKTVLRVRKYMAKKKQILQDAKSGGCTICGEKRLVCLDFHHPNNDKSEHHIANMVWFCGIEKLKAEIAKCVVVCSNCHRVIHEEENEKLRIIRC